MRYVLDTNVVSEAVKSIANKQVVAWLDDHASESFLTVITLKEIRYGVLCMPAGKRRQAYTTYLNRLIDHYKDRTLVFDAKAADICAGFHYDALRLGRTPDTEDLIIAAIAKSQGATVVTRNVKDFAYLDIDVVNPFEA